MAKSILLKINPKDWHYLGRWVDNVLDTDFWIHWTETRAIKKITNIKCSSNRLSIDGHFYYWKKTNEAVAKESYDAACKRNFSYFSNFCKVASEIIQRLIKVRSELSKKEKFTPNDLRKFFREFQELFTPWLIVFPIAEGLEKYFGEELKKHGLQLDDVQPLLRPSRDPELTKQHKEMQTFIEYLGRRELLDLFKNTSAVKIGKSLQSKSPYVYGKIKSHLKKYSWIGVHHFWGESLTLEKLFNEMREEAEKYPFKKENSNRVSVPGQLREYINTINELSYWRFRCAEITGFIVYSILPQLNNIANRLGLKYDYLYWFNRKEILDAFLAENKLSKNIAKKRKNRFGYLYLNGKEKIFTGNELKQVERIFSAKHDQSIRIIQGVTASKGEKVNGEVRIVAEPRDVKQFKKGEILVSPETTPDFIQAMKLASAIITDIGGLTSHAAIVSREFRKPCIIATKIATQVLKDGDLVEVDANKGVIKILKRK